MATKPVFRKDAGGTLSFVVDGSTTPDSATVTIYDENGTSAGTPSVTRSGTTLTASVSAGICDAIATNYRAEWSWVIGSTTYVDNQTFDVVKHELRNRASATDLTARYPILTGRAAGTVATAHANAITAAFEWLLLDIEARGKYPHDCVDYRCVKQAHLALAAAFVAENLRPGNDGTQDWQAWAADRRNEYRQQLDASLANAEWWDTNQDGVPAGDEQHTNQLVVTISR
jgi:hypothetical protein